MICKRCGKYNPDSKTICAYCGCSLETGQYVGGTESQKPFYNGDAWKGPSTSSYNPKTAVGVLMCLFLGLIGLIIGLLLYPSGTHERQTFLSGWLKCFVVVVVLGIIIGVFAYCYTLNLIEDIYKNYY